MNTTRCPRGWLDQPSVIHEIAAMARDGASHDRIARTITGSRPWTVSAAAVGQALRRHGMDLRGFKTGSGETPVLFEFMK